MRVKKVEYAGRYKLKILFSDKKTKIVDIEPIINNSKGLFHPLRDVEYFKKVFLDDDEYPLSICWPNGADICPDYLYELGSEIQTEVKPKSKLRRRKTISSHSQ
jgi:Protein of unknown function (DUF2442)